jgi:hypothetical protein
VIRCQNHAIAHTEIVQRTYDVKYFIRGEDLTPNTSETAEARLKEVEEFGIKSDRIRLIQVSKVHETTGLGKWQTVSVRIINEEEEYERQRQQEIAEQEEFEQQKQVPPSLLPPPSLCLMELLMLIACSLLKEQKKINENVLLEAGEVEDSLSSFDPYNTGIYRGIDISGRNAVVSQEV